MHSSIHRGRVARFITSLVLAAMASATSAAEPPLTLETALKIAEVANPQFRAAQANLAAAEWQVTDTRRLLWNNPQLRAEQARRKVSQPSQGNDTWSEWGVDITQTLEIAGQHGYRRSAAEQDLSALKEVVEETRWRVAAGSSRSSSGSWGFRRVPSPKLNSSA